MISVCANTCERTVFSQPVLDLLVLMGREMLLHMISLHKLKDVKCIAGWAYEPETSCF